MRAVTRGAATAAATAMLLSGLAGCARPARPASGYAAEARQVQQATPDSRPWFCNAAGNGTPLSGHGNGNHVNPLYAGQSKGPLTWPDCLALAGQLDQALAAVRPWDTLAKGEAGGWQLAAEYIAGLGTHHSRNGVLAAFGPTTFDPKAPTFLIYGGPGPDAPLVGVAYTLRGDQPPPPAFAGTNDWWHKHEKLCVDWAAKRWPPLILAGAEQIADDACTTLGGSNFTMPQQGLWLLHLWLMPPYQYRLDIFSSGHNCLTADGVAPQSDPCWQIAHRDPALGLPPGAGATDHGGDDH
jgi:hypothetical protein